MSKWDKLIERIKSLSKDMRFDELRAAIVPSESRAVCPSRSQRMSQLKLCML